MKYLKQPNIDDLTKLSLLANRPGLASYPALRSRLRRISGRYRSYLNGGGNAWHTSALSKRDLTDALRAALRRHYEKPPQLLDYIPVMRKEGSPLVCTMCGSLKPGTLDHVFPKSKYAEFSFFSKNLVPTCDCNTKRGETLKGSTRGERVLHPYFDKELKRRLVRATITASGEGYSKPEIGLLICIRPTTSLYSAVKFHLENVLEKTDVLSYLTQYWKSVLRIPEDYLWLPKRAFSIAEFNGAVAQTLSRLDRHVSTPNNWRSMLFAGINASPKARAFLMKTVRDLRAGRINAQDV